MKKLLVSLALGLSVLTAGVTGFAQTPTPNAQEAGATTGTMPAASTPAAADAATATEAKPATSTETAAKSTEAEPATSTDTTAKSATEETATTTTGGATGTAGGKHVIVRGDTLWDLAKAAYGEGTLWRRIAEANGNPRPRALHVGRELAIPAK